MYKTDFFIYEKNLSGNYDSIEPHYYVLETEERPTGKNIEDIILQACEIERIPDQKILVDMTIDKDGEYVDHDEEVFEISIFRTNELSDYIDWEKCPNLPPIYKVDREKSKIELII